MHHDHEHQIPIWLFIGSLLALYGFIIALSGLYNWWNPPARPMALAHFHADVWWGILMLIIGLAYVRHFWPGRKRMNPK